MKILYQPSRDLTRTTLSLLCIAILIAGTFTVMRYFLPALVWATMTVVATWPMLLALQQKLGGRRAPAAALMTIGLLLLLAVPLSLIVTTLSSNANRLAEYLRWFGSMTLPPVPEWISRIPLVGGWVATEWQQFASAGPDGVVAHITPHVGKITGWLASQVGSIGLLILHSLLAVFLSAILYAWGENAASGVRGFFMRLAGTRGDDAVQLAAKAIRAVALGVIVTALVQSLVATIGLVLVGIPYVAPLSVLIVILCVAQLGPGLVMIPSVLWLFWNDDGLRGTVLLAVAVIAMTVDNFLRPILIRKSADLPLLLIFSGVIGGLLSFGVIGLFIGPTVLAVSYTLVCAWIEDEQLA